MPANSIDVTKEIKNIIEAFEEAEKSGKQCCLATVVHVEGSSYRRPGARMLVTENGQLTGAISGGCLEGDALRKALLALAEGKNKLVTYDTSDEEDATIGVQLGCNGVIHILFEPIDIMFANHPINLLKQAVADRKKSAIVTLFSLKGSEQRGTKLLAFEDSMVDAALDSNVLEGLLKEARKTLYNESSTIGDFLLADQKFSAFIEYIEPQISLVVAGAGNDAIPLVEMANILGWHVTVVDGRPANATPHRFPKADAVIVARPNEVLSRVAVDAQTVFVLLTHNYNYDIELLSLLLKEPTHYIGLLGPKKKRERMLSELETRGIAITADQRSKIFGPTGLDIGAETAEEIALSILSEIKAVMSNKRGTQLRDKAGPIHSAASAKEP